MNKKVELVISKNSESGKSFSLSSKMIKEYLGKRHHNETYEEYIRRMQIERIIIPIKPSPLVKELFEQYSSADLKIPGGQMPWPFTLDSKIGKINE